MMAHGLGAIRSPLPNPAPTPHPQAAALFPAGTSLPVRTNNRQFIPWRFDQGSENTCIPHSTAVSVRYARKTTSIMQTQLQRDPTGHFIPFQYIQGLGPPPDLMPSRNFVYWLGRAIVGAQGVDGGMTMPEAMQVYGTNGFPDETLWPYGAATLAANPPASVRSAALGNLVPNMFWVGDIDDPVQNVPRTIIAAGAPIAFGISAYSSLESAATAASGVVTIPKPGETLLGGHSMLALDYDDEMTINGITGYYWCLNSWGAGWGIGGLALVPYPFFSNIIGFCWDHIFTPTPAAFSPKINVPSIPQPPPLTGPTGPTGHIH